MFLKGGDQSNHGDRIPAFWVGKNSQNLRRFAIHSSVGNNKNYGFHKRFPQGTKRHYLIHQYQACDGKDYFEVKRDDNSLLKVENTNAQDFSNVKVYASDPWYDTFDGTLENFVYTNQGISFQELMKFTSSGTYDIFYRKL